MTATTALRTKARDYRLAAEILDDFQRDPYVSATEASGVRSAAIALRGHAEAADNLAALGAPVSPAPEARRAAAAASLRGDVRALQDKQRLTDSALLEIRTTVGDLASRVEKIEADRRDAPEEGKAQEALGVEFMAKPKPEPGDYLIDGNKVEKVCGMFQDCVVLSDGLHVNPEAVVIAERITDTDGDAWVRIPGTRRYRTTWQSDNATGIGAQMIEEAYGIRKAEG